MSNLNVKVQIVKTIKFTPTHKTLIKKTGYCANCLAEIETKIRALGFWEQYEDYKIYTRMLIDGKIKLEELQQAYNDVKPFYEYVNEDGTTEKMGITTTSRRS